MYVFMKCAKIFGKFIQGSLIHWPTTHL